MAKISSRCLNLGVMKIAVIGGGISGLTAAYLLSKRYEVTLFEAAPKIGGHTHTVYVGSNGERQAVDMGFIVFNEKNYPAFSRLLARLGVDSQVSDMSFGVSSERTGLEYRASSLASFFAQRRNAFRPSFQRMLVDVVRFRRNARRLLANGNGYNPTLGEYLEHGRYSRGFVENFLVPMGSAVWSSDPARLESFPARYLMQFFENHRFLEAGMQLEWRTVRGGSERYVDRIIAPFEERIRLRSPVRAVRRFATHVDVGTDHGSERFDHVVIAAHSDQALRMLTDPSQEEEEILGAVPYHGNETVLHTDRAVMPQNRRAWASWNVRIPSTERSGVAVTYHSNRLQSLATPEDFLVTLNRTSEILPETVIEQMHFEHPVYSFRGLEAQKRHGQLNGKNRTSYCGAYWGYGFHEDGVQSALAAVRRFGVEL